ncbi:hypothetical protein [Pantoea sp.]|uniref:hypothetical protein n=1 Tax=Pantoea sp. TaxID=69393 RepID=UPI00289DBFC6|nr:hypothetical protein [Pantoea sp.]
MIFIRPPEMCNNSLNCRKKLNSFSDADWEAFSVSAAAFETFYAVFISCLSLENKKCPDPG